MQGKTQKLSCLTKNSKQHWFIKNSLSDSFLLFGKILDDLAVEPFKTGHPLLKAGKSPVALDPGKADEGWEKGSELSLTPDGMSLCNNVEITISTSGEGPDIKGKLLSV